tara:strand:- start:705 stop:1232 length:528 start_codon:yes stop_codon:yes gene_type:complete
MSINMRDSQAPDSENTTPQNLENCTVVTSITVEMILNDLAQGRNKEKIRQRYAYQDESGTVQPFEKWMVDEMFKDPNLRGRKPARKKVLPFSFKGTTETTKVTMTADSNGAVEVNHTVSEEPKYGIPGTEGGHQMTPEVSITSEETNSTTTFNVENDDYAQIIREENNNNLNNNN